MNITLVDGHKGEYRLNLHDQIKYCAKGNIKLKDIGEVSIRRMDWGFAMNLYDKAGKFVTNMAL